MLALCRADTLVKLHVNRPYNDVHEKFVSFVVKPEDLYDALDGKHRKAVTSMAALLGDAFVKFDGDFYFASNAPTRLRNPTKIIWKGFNRWTRAVNWTMIIPVPYAPEEWDSMHTLKILNTSYMVGITDCIWQLGTDFGSARAKDYVQELNTLKLMTDTFRPYVDDWRVMGADISAGSSVEETKKYVDMSRDVNAAYGWTQPANMLPASSLGSYIYDSDPALKSLRQQRVPLWLTLPEETSAEQQSISKVLLGDQTTDALRWAQTLGDAASSGFDVVFKRMHLADFQRPSFSYYVTALFKKVMGSRVFPARPLNAFAPSNKLYTHCANAVSGGLAFMVVNTETQPTTITVRSLTRLSSSEIWQYVLTERDEHIELNDKPLLLNSTLRPLIRPKDAVKPLQLITPSMSVGFWVLPGASLEHCQFTEIEAHEESAESTKEKRSSSSKYSSADRLLQRLIEETSVARGSLQSSINRHRRFVLDNDEQVQPASLLCKLLDSFKGLPGNVKRDTSTGRKSRRHALHPFEAMKWLTQVLEQTRDVAERAGRSRRNADSYSGPYFYNRQGKKTALTKKITEIRKPERKVKPLFDPTEFDEEEFFKKLGEQPEPPPYTRLPEGDVHLKHIETVDGEESESQPEPERISYKQRRPAVRRKMKIVQRSQEESLEERPEEQPLLEQARQKLQLLPTEFFEAAPPLTKPLKPFNLGLKLNSLLFPEPFSSKGSISKRKSAAKPLESIEQTPESDVEPVEPVEPVRQEAKPAPKSGHAAADFLQAQRELGKHFLSHIAEHEHEFSLGDEAARDASPETDLVSDLKPAIKQQPQQSLDHEEDYFGGKLTPKALAPVPRLLPQKPLNEGITAWWDRPALRRQRSLHYNTLDEALQSNAIDKNDRAELLPLGQYTYYEYKPAETSSTTEESKIMQISNTKSPITIHKITLSENIVSTVKTKVSKFMNIITRHMNEWYNTLTKHLESEHGKSRRTEESAANAIA
ncbi:CG14309 [Drosophila busckii]|uniref:CG14309 n=1 Tax=Drosophila busckii TaxID=30019 RepID=A0A0M4EHW9_DROBS|nr:CG14309 [Drosophila busckii]